MFDASRFLEEHFRDADGVVGLLGAYNLTPPRANTVQKWFQRGSVPSEWLPLLLCVLELENGSAIQIAKYVEWRGNYE